MCCRQPALLISQADLTSMMQERTATRTLLGNPLGEACSQMLHRQVTALMNVNAYSTFNIHCLVYALTNWSITCSQVIKMPPNCLTPKSPSSCMLMILSFCLSCHQVCKSVSMFYSFSMLSVQPICPKPRLSFSMFFALLTQTLSCILISGTKCFCNIYIYIYTCIHICGATGRFTT